MSLQRVVFDSSFLMAVVEHPTTWFEDIVDSVGKFQPLLLDCVRAELEKLASGQGRRSRAARASLELASGFKVYPCGKAQADDEIVSAALTQKAAVATVDADLAASLRAARIRVITLRSGRVHVG